jgi:tRNA(Ile)-lysidine synthase
MVVAVSVLSAPSIEAAMAVAGKRLVLAVSGGRDSIAMLHAAARGARRSVAMVATFDHGTGRHATRAVLHVEAQAAQLGFPCVVGRDAMAPGDSEEAWRNARRAFLRDVARATGGTVTTAHTLDDHLETVVMRVLRDTGGRGLAGLYAPSDTARPLLHFSRAELSAYAREVGATWVDDPTNESRRFFRNRVRLDLLPAMERVRPDFAERMLGLSREAAEVRRRIDAFVARLVRVGPGDRLSVAVSAFAGYSRSVIAGLWPAIAARVGLAMDWRGTERAASFTITGRPGGRIQLSGGWEILRSRSEFELRRWKPVTSDSRLVTGREP